MIHPRYAIPLLFLALASCRGQGAAPGGLPPMPVEAITLATKPVEQTTEFVGTVKSRRSTTVQPQVEGFITSIRARSGDRVGVGAPLMEIDPRLQQAALSNLDAQRASRQADVQYARSRPRA